MKSAFKMCLRSEVGTGKERTGMSRKRIALVSVPLVFSVGLMVSADQQPSATQPQPQAQQPPEGGRGRGGGGFGGGIAPLPFDDRTGFESMFNGASLNPGEQQAQAAAAKRAAERAAEEAKAKASGQPLEAGRGRGRGRGGFGDGPPISRFQDWDGDPRYWRVEGGVIVGETKEKFGGPNTFLIWRGATPGDFELKVEVKMNSTNSGIQYRSRMIPPNQGQSAGEPGHAWRLAGYQMDMDFGNRYPGILYEEGGRAFLAERGTATYIAPDGTKHRIGQLKTAEELAASFKPGEWNQFHLIARGNTLIHIVNGLLTAVCVDDDLKGRSMAGLIGFQLHSGPPMKLEIRNPAIKLK
jgi:hypothetical protein